MRRRDFIVLTTAAGTGLLVGPRLRRSDASPAQPSYELGPFIEIGADGAVTIVVSRPEMGQGVRTSLPMLVAEELDVELSGVRIVQGDLDARYGPQFTGGSAVIRTAWEPLRQAGAAARHLLIAAAATRWGVAVESCVTEPGVVVHPASGRRAGYGALAGTAAGMTLPERADLKPRERYRIIGRSVRSIDAPAIARGTMTFGIDVRVPGMVYASIERAPTPRARPVRIDEAAARAVRGVTDVVTIDADAIPSFGSNSPKPRNGVAVVATSTWAAMKARRALRIEWTSPDAEPDSIDDTERMREFAERRASEVPEHLVLSSGDAAGALGRSARTVDATYELPLLAHAPMEPLNATVSVRNGRVEAWAPTQNPDGVRKALAAVTGVAAESVTVHLIRMGGSFGRRFYADYVAEAGYLSSRIGKPVQVLWTREDDTRFGFYRPAGYHKLSGGVSADGRLTAWKHHLVNASRGHFLKWRGDAEGDSWDPEEVDRFGAPAGLIEHCTVGYSSIRSDIPRGQWRAVEASATVLVSECFIDELAHAAERDPLEFRLELLGPPRTIPFYSSTYDTGRLAAVLRLVADRSGWTTRAGGRRALGIAGAYANSAYAAHVAHVERDGDGVRVRKVVSAIDAGTIVNPLGARAQVEGSIAYALGSLAQEITVSGGRVRQGNFNDYPVLRIDRMPEIEVHLVESSQPVRGLGEPALPPLAPAVLNAVFAATGVRVRRLPVDLATFLRSSR